MAELGSQAVLRIKVSITSVAPVSRTYICVPSLLKPNPSLAPAMFVVKSGDLCATSREAEERSHGVLRT